MSNHLQAVNKLMFAMGAIEPDIDALHLQIIKDCDRKAWRALATLAIVADELRDKIYQEDFMSVAYLKEDSYEK